MSVCIMHNDSYLNIFWLAQEIADGEVKIDFKLFLLPFDLTLELCETLQKIGEDCPIKEGSGAFNVTATIPDILPVSELKL